MGTIYLTNIFHKILTYSKYTFRNPNTPNHIPYISQNTHFYIHRVATKLVTFVIMGHKLVFLDEN
jgi:hypothetical protein